MVQNEQIVTLISFETMLSQTPAEQILCVWAFLFLLSFFQSIGVHLVHRKCGKADRIASLWVSWYCYPTTTRSNEETRASISWCPIDARLRLGWDSGAARPSTQQQQQDPARRIATSAPESERAAPRAHPYGHDMIWYMDMIHIIWYINLYKWYHDTVTMWRCAHVHHVPEYARAFHILAL